MGRTWRWKHAWGITFNLLPARETHLSMSSYTPSHGPFPSFYRIILTCQTVAIFILQKILLDDQGLQYICGTYDRFLAVAQVLSVMVNVLVEMQAVRLLKHVVRCYLRLSDHPKYPPFTAPWLLSPQPPTNPPNPTLRTQFGSLSLLPETGGPGLLSRGVEVANM